MNTENQRNTKLRNGVNERYTSFLNELYYSIKNQENISLNNITTNNNVGTQLAVILKNLNIIKKTKHKKYIWIGKRPTPELVSILIEQARLYNSKAANKAKEIKQVEIEFKEPIRNLKPILNLHKEKIEPNKNNLSFSLFWGLIKFNKY